MIDYFRAVAKVPFDQLQPSLPWQESTYKDTREAARAVSYFKEKGLRVNYSHTTGTLSVAGSLQKFAKGNNHSGFTYGDIGKSMLRLKYFLGISPSLLVVRELEASVTVQHHPIYDMLAGYKTTAFAPMCAPGGGRQYGIAAQLSQYRVKIYDKTLERALRRENVAKGLMQVEYKIERLRWYNGQFPSAPIHTVADLAKPDQFFQLGILLKKMAENFTPSGAFDRNSFRAKHPDLSPYEILAIFTMHDSPAGRQYIKEFHPNTYKKVKPIYESVKGDIVGDYAEEMRSFRSAVEAAVEGARQV